MSVKKMEYCNKVAKLDTNLVNVLQSHKNHGLWSCLFCLTKIIIYTESIFCKLTFNF